MEDHEQAWGGFRFSGRIRKDGSILLKRKAVGIDLICLSGGTSNYNTLKLSRKTMEMVHSPEHGSSRAGYVSERFLSGHVPRG